MNRKIKYFIVFLILCILFFTIFYLFRDNDNKLSENKKIHGIVFSDLKIKKSNKKYKIKVKLTSKKDVKAEYFNVELKDKNNKSLSVLSGYIGNIKKDEIKYVEMETSDDLKNAYEVIYTVYVE